MYCFLFFCLLTVKKIAPCVGIGKAFGFSVPPRVDLNLSARGDKSSTRQKKRPRALEDSDHGPSGNTAAYLSLTYSSSSSSSSSEFIHLIVCRRVEEECIHVLWARLQRRQSLWQESCGRQATVRAIANSQSANHNNIY